MKRIFQKPQPNNGGRARSTSKRVYIVDAIANAVVTTGGLGVVVAVFAICFYLVAVVVHLFLPGSVEESIERRVAIASAPLFTQADEHITSALVLSEDGVLRAFKIETGEVTYEESVTPEGRTITAWSRMPRDGHTAIGYDDGTFQIGKIEFRSEFLFDEEAEEALKDLPIGAASIYRDGVVQRTPIGQLRKMRPEIELAAPATLRSGEGAVRLISYQVNVAQEFVAAIREDGSAIFNRVRKT
ncbi:MAG: hypothetical protein EA379_00025, partial [Phycisphaerales bacterium]